MKKYKAIIYDLDGTVLNTINMNMYPLIKIIKEETGEDWTFEQVLKFLPYPGMKVMEELQVADKEKTYARWVKYVNEYEEGASLYPGFEEIFDSDDVCVVEWANFIEDILPVDRLTIEIKKIDENIREFVFKTNSEKYAQVVEALT